VTKGNDHSGFFFRTSLGRCFVNDQDVVKLHRVAGLGLRFANALNVLAIFSLSPHLRIPFRSYHRRTPQITATRAMSNTKKAVSAKVSRQLLSECADGTMVNKKGLVKLLKMGADMEWANNMGNTCLHAAAGRAAGQWVR
jgi:hypothetical protein